MEKSVQFNTIIIILSVLFILGFILYKLTKKDKVATKAVEEDQEISVDLSNLAENLLESYHVAVDPTSLGKPVLYALVTCQHCIRTQRFLKENSIDYKLIHVDLFEGDVRKNIMKVLKTFNAKGSFPTFITPSGSTVVGFKENLLREALKNDAE